MPLLCLKDFLRLLGSNASQTTREYLTQFLDCTDKAGSFGFKINECLGLSEKMRNSLAGRRKQLDSDIVKKKADPGANQDLIAELRWNATLFPGLSAILTNAIASSF